MNGLLNRHPITQLAGLLGSSSSGFQIPNFLTGGQRPADDPGMRWAMLDNARDMEGADQAKLGPVEHGAWAEYDARKNPITGPLNLLWMVPAYEAAKAAGLRSGRSPASLDSMAEGYRGMWRGVEHNLSELFR